MDRAVKQHIQAQIDEALPGEIITLPDDFKPHLLLVKIDIDVQTEMFPAAWGTQFSDDMKSVVVTIDHTPYPVYSHESEAVHIYPDPTKGIRSGRIGYTSFRVEPFLASTILKIQGLTVPKYEQCPCVCHDEWSCMSHVVDVVRQVYHTAERKIRVSFELRDAVCGFVSRRRLR
jgi:hypothetical protein